MNKLDELIKKLCPNGVEYKKISDVCEKVFAGGTPKTSVSDYYDGEIPWLRSGEINFNIITKSERNITDAGLKNSSAKIIRKNSVLIAMTGATVARSAVNVFATSANQSVCALETNEDVIGYKFLYFCVESMYAAIKGMAQGALTSINLDIIKGIIVPVPPLEVQQEIVRILEKFSELDFLLNKELFTRKKQLSGYSRLLFDDIKENTKTYTLSEICTVEKGKTPIQKATPGNYPMVVTTSERKSSNEYQFDANAVCIPLVSSRGHGVASLNHVYYQEGKFALGNILCAIISKNESLLDPQYLYYYFEETKDYTLVPLMKGGANVALRIDDLLTLKIPVPDLEKQKIIVKNLEIFDEICNSKKNGLPAEIEARKKQYEYYRDKLLDFKELA